MQLDDSGELLPFSESYLQRPDENIPCQYPSFVCGDTLRDGTSIACKACGERLLHKGTEVAFVCSFASVTRVLVETRACQRSGCLQADRPVFDGRGYGVVVMAAIRGRERQIPRRLYDQRLLQQQWLLSSNKSANVPYSYFAKVASTLAGRSTQAGVEGVDDGCSELVS